MAKNDSALPKGAEEHAVKILTRVWTLSRKRKAAKSQRENLFTERDSIDAEIEELADKHSPEGAELAAKWRDICKKIEKLKLDIEFYSDEIGRAIDDGEQGKFEFLDDDLKPAASLYEKLKPKKPEEPKKDDRPVGVPNANGKPQLRITPPEGKDEQLGAAVSELDLPDHLSKTLHERGYHTIRDIAEAIDKGVSLQAALGRGVDNAELVVKAVGKYRKKHRSAIVQAEREAEEAAS